MAVKRHLPCHQAGALTVAPRNVTAGEVDEAQYLVSHLRARIDWCIMWFVACVSIVSECVGGNE
jgi:hypothetical protein